MNELNQFIIHCFVSITFLIFLVLIKPFQTLTSEIYNNIWSYCSKVIAKVPLEKEQRHSYQGQLKKWSEQAKSKWRREQRKTWPKGAFKKPALLDSNDILILNTFVKTKLIHDVGKGYKHFTLYICKTSF